MEFRFLDPATEISARGLGEHVCAAFEDVDALDEFRQGLDVVTYEFENVPVESARWLAERVPVHPSPEALRVAQDRLFEKRHFRDLGVAVPPFADFFFRDEFNEALRRIGLPAVLKTRRFGYDGKGQRVIRAEADVEQAWKDLYGIPLFIEGFVPFDREVSLLAVRGRTGEFRAWPLVENHHREGILRLSIAPAPEISEAVQRRAESHAKRVMDSLGYVGVLAIEFFLCGSELLANEMAPRVHNSGHWSIEGAETSQFENHLRAVAGLSLGPTGLRGHSAMVNLIGEVSERVADWPDAHFHDYGKKPRAGRKVAHTTLVDESLAGLRNRLAEFEAATGLPGV
jgi:5-(carboxyamino)imidazole ribonucleotide synthase